MCIQINITSIIIIITQLIPHKQTFTKRMPNISLNYTRKHNKSRRKPSSNRKHRLKNLVTNMTSVHIHSPTKQWGLASIGKHPSQAASIHRSGC